MIAPAERFREMLALLRWTQRGFASIIGADDRLVRRWAAGEADMPAEILVWLETLAAVHVANPVPNWRKRAAG